MQNKSPKCDKIKINTINTECTQNRENLVKQANLDKISKDGRTKNQIDLSRATLFRVLGNN